MQNRKTSAIGVDGKDRAKITIAIRAATRGPSHKGCRRIKAIRQTDVLRRW